MSTMKAAVVVPALGAPLEIREILIPTPGPGQVLLRGRMPDRVVLEF